MACNVGKTERIIRLGIGFVVLGVGRYLNTEWGLLGFIPILTSVVGWCPINALLKVSTCEDSRSTFPDTSAKTGCESPLCPVRDR